MANLSVFSALSNLVRKDAILTPVSNRGWYPIINEPYTGAWQKNDPWSAETVLAHHAVYACITLIANDIGKLRHKLVEQDSDGIWSETDSTSFSPVLRRPNRYQNHIQFKQWWVTSKLIRGNSYALKARDQRRIVTALYLLDPTRVKVLVAPDGSIFYDLTIDNLNGIEEAVIVPASEIIHDRMNCLFHPLVGVSPLFASGTSANLGLTIQKNSDKFFGNGSSPGGILMIPGSIPQEKADELKTKWDTNYGGDNTGKIAILADGMKFQAMKMTAVESQLIEQLKWTAEVVCSTFHVPAYKIGVGTAPTYNNIEALQADYYATCLQSHIEEYEACMDEGLGIETRVAGRQLGVELDLDGLLRMDTQTQVSTLKESVGGGLITTDEARKKLDLKPVEGGDVIWRQQQEYSIAALAKRDENDPFAKPPPPVVPPVTPPSTPPPPDTSAKDVEFALIKTLKSAPANTQQFMRKAA